MTGCGDHCCPSGPPERDDRLWRGIVWVALILNAAMFLIEVVSGLAAGSASLQADAVDFLADALNYAVSLGIAGMVLGWRARVALLKGASMLALGASVLGMTAVHAYEDTLPRADVMGGIGTLALVTNLAVAVMLFRFRGGDANRQSVWICSRNDAIGNVAVLLAALGVFGSGTGWPDIIVAAIMAVLAITGGLHIVRKARSELRHVHAALLPVVRGAR